MWFAGVDRKIVTDTVRIPGRGGKDILSMVSYKCPQNSAFSMEVQGTSSWLHSYRTYEGPK